MEKNGTLNKIENNYDLKENHFSNDDKDSEKQTKPGTGIKESTKLKVSNNKKIIGFNKLKSLKESMLNTSINFLKNLGKIEYAEIHREANIPLKKVGKWSDKTVFCKCCNLACKEEGVMEEYNFFDDTDDFIQNGQAISLYFSFYKYSIFILLLAFLTMSLPCLIISYQRSNELNKLCNNIYTKKSIKNIKECEIYLDQADNIEDKNKNQFNFILDFSGINIKNYKIVHQILTNKKTSSLNKIFINYSVLNFISIWAILLIYFGYLIFIYNKSYLPDIDIVSPKKYSIMITGMDGFYTYMRTRTKYLSDTKEPEINEVKNNDIKQSSERESKEEKTISGVKKFENVFQEKLSEIFFDDKQTYNIKKVNVCFKINKYMELQERLERCDEIINLMDSPYQNRKNIGVEKSQRKYYYSPFTDFHFHICEKCDRSRKLSDIIKEKEEVLKKLNDLKDDINEVNMEKFAGAVIVSFNTIKEKEEFMSHIPQSFFLDMLKFIGKIRYFVCCCCIDKIDKTKFVMKYLKINIEEAPIPEDIIFENLEFTPQSKVYRVVGINMISLLLICIGFAIIFGLQQLQAYVKEKDYNQIIYFLISLCITIAISIINVIFEELLDMLTKQEKQSSINNYYLSYSVKLTIFSFATKAIIPLVIEVLFGTSNYEFLTTNMLLIFLANSIINPIIWTFNITPIYWIKKLKICLIERNEQKYLNMNQRKLNELYEKSDMNIAEKYAHIARTLLMTFLYISIFPFGVLISLGGLILCFLLEKYNYINNYKRPEVLNNTLFFYYLENYVFILFFLGFGDYLFLSDVFNNKGWSLVNIVFLAALIIIPYSYFLKQDFIGFKESEINKNTYEDAYLDFIKNYDRINPMTSAEGTKNYIEELYKKGYISKEQRDQNIKDFSKINLMEIYYQNRSQRNNMKIQKSLVSSIKQSISKSYHPNTKKMFLLSTIFDSFNENKRNKDRPKTIVGPIRAFNPFDNKKKIKDRKVLLMNDNNKDDSKNNKNEKINLNVIEELKEEESIHEEKEKEEKIYYQESSKNIINFYDNSIMYRICGCIQVFEKLDSKKNEEGELSLSEKEEYESEERN